MKRKRISTMEASSKHNKKRPRSPSALPFDKEEEQKSKRTLRKSKAKELLISRERKFPLQCSSLFKIISLGRINYTNPEYHSEKFIFPVGYKCEINWISLLKPPETVWYNFEVLQGKTGPSFVISLFNISFESTTLIGVCNRLQMAIDKERLTRGLGKGNQNILQMFSIHAETVAAFIEEMPGALLCENYQFKIIKYGKTILQICDDMIANVLKERESEKNHTKNVDSDKKKYTQLKSKFDLSLGKIDYLLAEIQDRIKSGTLEQQRELKYHSFVVDLSKAKQYGGNLENTEHIENYDEEGSKLNVLVGKILEIEADLELETAKKTASPATSSQTRKTSMSLVTSAPSASAPASPITSPPTRMASVSPVTSAPSVTTPIRSSPTQNHFDAFIDLCSDSDSDSSNLNNNGTPIQHEQLVDGKKTENADLASEGAEKNSQCDAVIDLCNSSDDEAVKDTSVVESNTASSTHHKHEPDASSKPKKNDMNKVWSPAIKRESADVGAPSRGKSGEHNEQKNQIRDIVRPGNAGEGSRETIGKSKVIKRESSDVGKTLKSENDENSEKRKETTGSTRRDTSAGGSRETVGKCKVKSKTQTNDANRQHLIQHESTDLKVSPIRKLKESTHADILRVESSSCKARSKKEASNSFPSEVSMRKNAESNPVRPTKIPSTCSTWIQKNRDDKSERQKTKLVKPDENTKATATVKERDDNGVNDKVKLVTNEIIPEDLKLGYRKPRPGERYEVSSGYVRWDSSKEKWLFYLKGSKYFFGQYDDPVEALKCAENIHLDRLKHATVARSSPVPTIKHSEEEMHTFKAEDINKFLMCKICGGYCREAYTIMECLHSFCKLCIDSSIHSTSLPKCPRCEVRIEAPLDNMVKPDHIKQEIIALLLNK